MWAVAVLGVATTTRGAGTTRLGLGKVPDDTNALPTVSLYPNENNVFSRAVLRNSTKEVVYLGNFPSSAGCQAACISQGSCKSFTYHEPNFDPVWATGCYASTTRFWKPVAESNVLTGTVGWTPPNAPPTPGPPTPSPPCRTRADCSMNGECDSSGVCRCTAAWTGSACDALNLVPSPKTLGYHAVDAASRNKTASWGGSIVYDDDGSAHMYAAEITGSCGMNVWLSNSRVIHAESPDPTTTPFTFAGEVAGVFSHEPIARRAPTGEYVVWFTAVLPPALPPVNGGKECTGCVDGVSPASCGTDSNRNSTTPLPTYMVWSTEPNGPWSTPVMIPGTAVFADSNFAPVIHANGSLVGLMRRNVVLADYWKDPSSYRFVATWNDHGEDPYVWLDADGVYHNIVHVGRANTHGLHYWSLDGVSWTASAGPAYNSTIAYSDGTSLTLGCRERPHVVQDLNKNIVGLTNGAAPVTCHTAGGDDYAFTSLQIVKSD